MIVGLPRSVFYYYYFPFWSCFFQELGMDCLVSPPTNQAILQKGLSMTVDELCLPIKIHLGHLAYLENKTDLVFSPGFGRVAPKSFFCPKLMGLPDLARYKIPRAIEFWHEFGRKGALAISPWRETIRGLWPELSNKSFKNAWQKAWERQRAFWALWEMGYKPPEAIDYLTWRRPLAEQEGRPLRIAVLGHPYLVYDETANHHLPRALADAGARTYAQETIPLAERNKEWPGQNKTVYWPLGQQILAAALYYTVKERMDGLVFLSACLCGPDALIGELLARYLASQRHAPPLLKLTMDEHTSGTGLLTRIEAFIDLLCWRKEHGAC